MLTLVLISFCRNSCLRFSFFFPSFSLQAGVLRLLRRLSTRRPPLSDNILVLLLDPAEAPDASTVGTGAKVLSPFDADSGGGSQASALRQQRTSPRSTRPLPSSRRRRRTSSSLERRALNERLPRNEESLLPRCSITIHQLPSAGRVSKCAAALAPSSPASFSEERRSSRA